MRETLASQQTRIPPPCHLHQALDSAPAISHLAWFSFLPPHSLSLFPPSISALEIKLTRPHVISLAHPIPASHTHLSGFLEYPQQVPTSGPLQLRCLNFTPKRVFLGLCSNIASSAKLSLATLSKNFPLLPIPFPSIFLESTYIFPGGI